MKDQETQLYRHYDADGVLLYVGISVSALGRLISHKSQSDWFRHVAKVEIENYPTRPEAERAECMAIKKEHPLYNQMHNTTRQMQLFLASRGIGKLNPEDEDFKDMPEVWRLVREKGKTLEYVADKFDVSVMTISRRLKKYESNQ